jgi:DNA-binding CsgD family transcriptional regulator
MSEGLRQLTEREKETLRLLFSGHDIKSIASHLGLSPHTVNERLREARRKLGVSSSRQAARLLAAGEPHDSIFSADKHSGVVRPAASVDAAARSDQWVRTGRPLIWLGGGMLAMSLIIAAIAVSIVLQPHASPGTESRSKAIPVSATSVPDSASERSARDWVALLDQERWADSWSAAGTLFKANVAKTAWTAQIQSVRQRLGPASSRLVQNVTEASSLPGAPDGEYEIIQFLTNFEHKNGATETVVLSHEPPGWRVVGYFIK